MNLTNLYATLQTNPRSKDVYRKLKEKYELLGMLNEAKAFQELIEKKFNADSSNNHKEQSKNPEINS
jgi:hypothetical protein